MCVAETGIKDNEIKRRCRLTVSLALGARTTVSSAIDHAIPDT